MWEQYGAWNEDAKYKSGILNERYLQRVGDDNTIVMFSSLVDNRYKRHKRHGRYLSIQNIPTDVSDHFGLQFCKVMLFNNNIIPNWPYFVMLICQYARVLWPHNRSPCWPSKMPTAIEFPKPNSQFHLAGLDWRAKLLGYYVFSMWAIVLHPVMLWISGETPIIHWVSLTLYGKAYNHCHSNYPVVLATSPNREVSN